MLVLLRLLVHPLLFRNIREEVLDVLVLQHSLVEEVLPDAVELELTGLDLAVRGFQQEEPELLNEL